MRYMSEWNGISRIIMFIDIVFRKRKDRLTTSTPIRNTSVREQGGRLLKSDGIMYTTSVNRQAWRCIWRVQDQCYPSNWNGISKIIMFDRFVQET